MVLKKQLLSLMLGFIGECKIVRFYFVIQGDH